MDNYRDRARGMLTGLAVGDALGAPIEFGFSSSEIQKMGDKIFHFYDSPRGHAGEWTDDTSMALCIADSLLEKHGYDSYDIMDKYYRWVQEGYRSHNGKPADDVGNQTRLEIIKYHRDPILHKGEPKTESAGNAPIMRLAPIVLASVSMKNKYEELQNDGGINNKVQSRYRERKIKDLDLTNLTELAVLSCRETHNSFVAEIVTEMFSLVLFTALYAKEKSDIRFFADKCYYLESQGYDEFRIYHNHLLIDRAYNANPEELCDLGGYIVDAFAIALWGFLHSDSFEEGMKKVLYLGGDADTNAAIYGQIAGAYYGYKAIPEEWRKNVYLGEEIVDIADELLDIDECPVIRTRFEDNEYFKIPEELTKTHTHKNTSLASSNGMQSIGDILKERFK